MSVRSVSDQAYKGTAVVWSGWECVGGHLNVVCVCKRVCDWVRGVGVRWETGRLSGYTKEIVCFCVDGMWYGLETCL